MMLMNGDEQPNSPPPQDNWAYHPDAQPQANAEVPDATPQPVETSVQWSASEFIAHQKTVLWYLVVTLASLALATGIYFVSGRDAFSTGAIVAIAIIFMVAASRKPRTRTYTLDSSGLTVGKHFYSYGQFKSFSVHDEGPFSSISFMPLKRFMPTVDIYFAPEDQDRVLNILGQYLPFAQKSNDLLERAMRRIHF
jgi:hypothetical protein